METRVAVITIIIEKLEMAPIINEKIHDYSSYVIGRMGIPYYKKGISIISLVIDAPQNKISALSGKLGRLDGVSVKASYSNVTGTE